MTDERIERLRVLLRSSVATDLFDFIDEQGNGARSDLLTASDHVSMFRAQGAANAIQALHRALTFIRDTNAPEEGTIPPAFSPNERYPGGIKYT